MIQLSDLTYLQQLRQLRKIALSALAQYPIKVKKITFINHGENTTYKITAANNKNYLLRIHRLDYHTLPALKEEMKWLEQLNKRTNLSLQKPVISKTGQSIISIDSIIGKRPCSLLTWNEGKMKHCRHTVSSFKNLGLLISELHINSKIIKLKHRNYWRPEGLIGNNAKWGNINDLKSIAGKNFSILKKTQKQTLNQLKKYEANNKTKMGLIHADLHFSNMVWQKHIPLPIDFDDCGHGAFMYDLAVTLLASNYVLEDKPKKERAKYQEALLNAYSANSHLNITDIKIIEAYKVARRLNALCWLNTRREIPRLNNYLKKKLPKEIKFFKNLM